VPYNKEPFAADVSEGKNDPIYNAHSYHTKVPHKAIMRYILHYTEPGDVVFDGFCGTGMTGVAAQLCGDRKTVESLGYKVDDQGVIYQQEEETDESGLPAASAAQVGGKGPIPVQIVSWMKQSADLRNIILEELASGRATEENGQLSTQHSTLITRAKARWYVPDPNKAGDLEKLRERALLREFEEYRESKQKRLKVFRLEAIRAGFKKAWQERDYATIIAVARKIPENILQEDPKLLMWYDQAFTRSGEE